MENLFNKKEIIEQIALLKLSLIKEGYDMDAIGFREKGKETFNILNVPDFDMGEK